VESGLAALDLAQLVQLGGGVDASVELRIGRAAAGVGAGAQHQADVVVRQQGPVVEDIGIGVVDHPVVEQRHQSDQDRGGDQ